MARVAFLKKEMGAKNADEWVKGVERDSGKKLTELNEQYKKWRGVK